MRADSIRRLNWKQQDPVWVDQWSLSEEKLRALEVLVEEQLSKGHIVPSTSPWNTPIFVIKKPGKNKWRLLQDLRKINDVLEDFGPVQSGLPSPSMLPRDWPLAVIDIKDCFLNIPLHPADAPRFAFSVPTLNQREPLRRYHWTVLPQGVKNSPTICLLFVAEVISPVRAKFPDFTIFHTMDDLLLCAPTSEDLQDLLKAMTTAIKDAGFEIQPDKVQLSSPWRYLGLQLRERTIRPQEVQINDRPKTLHDLQQLCSSINWVRPFLGITTEDLAPLFNLLPGDSCPTSLRTLTPEAETAIQVVQEALRKRQSHRRKGAHLLRSQVMPARRYHHSSSGFLFTVWIWMAHVNTMDAWLVRQLQENVWVTLARALQQQSRCLSTGNTENPLVSCLVGIPLKPNEYPFTGKTPNPIDSWDDWTGIYPHAPEEPQELDLLGSSQAMYCVNFFFQKNNKKNYPFQSMSNHISQRTTVLLIGCAKLSGVITHQTRYPCLVIIHWYSVKKYSLSAGTGLGQGSLLNCREVRAH